MSNSYGTPEYTSEVSDDASYFNHPGVAITASSGDDGYGVGYGTEYPAASRYVTAVGGTTLIQDPTTIRGYRESAWGSPTNTAGGAGSGCSSYDPKPGWQHDPGCGTRTVADVAAVADPTTGVAAYDSTPDSSGQSGWLVFGGTGVGAPLIAATYALAVPPTPDGYPAALPYQSRAGKAVGGLRGLCQLRDVG